MQGEEVLRQQLAEKVSRLPESRIREVLDFVDVLSLKQAEPEDPILHVAGCLSGQSVSAEEIEQDLYGNDPA